MPHPVPIPEPSDELLASTRELEIDTTPIELDPESQEASAVPIPEPHDELFAETTEFQIAIMSILEFPPI
jgi:hypothetical protein